MLILECARADYWQSAFVIPILIIAFLLILLLIAVCRLVDACRNSEPLGKSILSVVSSLVTLALLFAIKFPTFRHGVFLPMATEEEAQYRQGVVTAITDVPFSPRYSISGSSETYRASLVRINEEEFYFLSAEGLEVGQEVVISFLPGCDMVLTCKIVED